MEKPLREDIFEYVKNQYGSEIEYLWQDDPDSAVFRRNDNKKWFGIIMNIPYKYLGCDKDGDTDVLNVKIDDNSLLDFLLHCNGFFPAYHMNKRHWITVLLDKTIELQKIFDLIDMSFDATSSNKKSKKS